MAPAAALLAGCDAPHAIEGDFAGVAETRGHTLRDVRGWPPPAVQKRAQVLIAGAGIAGLAATRSLMQRGIDDFAVLELDDTAGGNSRSGRVGNIACPLGAHYLPIPGDDAPEVQDLLEDFGLRRRVNGRWEYDELARCHSPQERLYMEGMWHDGLLPQPAGEAAGRAAQQAYRAFADRVEALRRTARFAMPALRAPVAPEHLALDGQTFAAWLDAEGLVEPHLRWYLDYCCRDDYGAGTAAVSAWAGIHYFASRHGFHAPGDDVSAADADAGVLTWPQGNGWLADRLASPLGERLSTGRTVLRIAETRTGVEVDAWDHAAQQVERWRAARCIVALPAFIAARVVENPPAAVQALAAQTRHAPWLVANLHLDAPLADRPGAAPSWDNVLYGTAGLGYVNARHQWLDPRPGPTVLTWYEALGDQPEARRALLEQPWSAWRDRVLDQIAVPHPDIRQRTQRLEITRYGHAMAIPAPGRLALLHQLGAAQPRAPGGVPLVRTGRLAFAHADWAGYSVFEEAFTRGHAAGLVV